MDINRLQSTFLALCKQTGIPKPVARTPIRIWQKSGVERLRLADTTTVIVKYAGPPFTGEAQILQAAAERNVPVPAVFAAHQADGLLVMLLEDLGNRLREPTDHDGAVAAARLHRADIDRRGLEVWDAHRLARLPSTAIEQLTALHDAGRLPATKSLLTPLHQLAQHADELVEGADIEPFGIVHGELHPTSVHIGKSGWRLVDFAMAFVGPGLLDLATWQGTRQPPGIGRLENQLHDYVTTGGPASVLQPRGGLPAATWALGWHRIWSAGWLLRQTTTADDREDPYVTAVLLRQINAAAAILLPTRRIQHHSPATSTSLHNAETSRPHR